MNSRGHYFCEGRCDDVVPNLAYAGSALVRCPVCHQLTAHWVPDEEPRVQRVMVVDDVPVAAPAPEECARLAAVWFGRMHAAVEAVT